MIKTLTLVAVAAAFILLVPLLAMQFTDEVVWDLTDFVAAGILLFGTGLTYELIVRDIDPEWILRSALYRISVVVSEGCAGTTSRGHRAGGLTRTPARVSAA